MKILALILSILALIWCCHMHYGVIALKHEIYVLKSEGTEKIIYHVVPKHKKPDFGRIAGWDQQRRIE